MHSPPDEPDKSRMEAAHALAAGKLGLVCTGDPVWGVFGSTLGRRADQRWLRVSSSTAGAGRTSGQGILGASTDVPDDVPRPRLHDVFDWTEGQHVYMADVIDFIAHPVISPHRPDLDHAPELPDAWWDGLRTALARLGTVRGQRTTVRDQWIARAFPQFLGILAPARIDRVAGHGDLHWGNLTSPLTILDWERWGHVPFGFDAGLLHAHSLLVPDVAARIRREFAHVLDTPAGRIGELAALAEMLQATARGWYPDLRPALAARAAHLTGRTPPQAAAPELPTD